MTNAIAAMRAAPAVALVSRAPRPGETCEAYLRVGQDGAPEWVDDPAQATVYDSMHEAMRAATRLPASLRAYGVLRGSEFAVWRSAL